MPVIITNAIRERIRRKEYYIVLAIGALLFLLCSSGTASISIDGESVTGFRNMFMVLHTLMHAMGCILAVVLSISAIPNEYERRNSHLVWVRGISQPEYHGGLTLANIVGTMMAVAVFYIWLAVYAVVHGYTRYVIRLIPALLITAISVVAISLLVSVLSIQLPVMAVGTIGTLFAGCGLLHGTLALVKSTVGGIGGKCLSVLLLIVPDLNCIQKQAYHFIIGEKVQPHPLFVGLLTVYIISFGIFILRKKEA